MAQETREDGNGKVVLPAQGAGSGGTPSGSWKLGGLHLGDFIRRFSRMFEFGHQPARDTATSPAEADFAQVRAWCQEAHEKNGRQAGLKAIARVADAYRHLDSAGRERFFYLLRDEFGVNHARVEAAARSYLEGGRGHLQTGSDAQDDLQEHAGAQGANSQRAEALVELHYALESPRLTLFRLFNTIPSGIKFLVDLRADLYRPLKRDASLSPLEYELRRVLETFFNLGFLRLERITWESPALLLENLVRYEAVNAIHGWDDLKHRLVSDRACYAFLHPSLPNEPVIFVEVALTQGMAGSVQALLDVESPDLPVQQADTAIFYGISNAQVGLRGIPFGNMLIKQVAVRLQSEHPQLGTFATLSPMPRFRVDFLEPAIADGSIAGYFTEEEGRAVLTLMPGDGNGADDLAGVVGAMLAEPGWHTRADWCDALRPGLLRAARHYIIHARRGGKAMCPVAHFHGSNGALLARVNWLGDTSANGLAQSAGVMVNYLYDLAGFERYQQEYLQSGTLSMSDAVEKL